MRLTLPPGFGRDFAAPLLVIGLPYSLAVLVQDVVVPAMTDGGTITFAAIGLSGMTLVLTLLWWQRRRHPARNAGRADALIRTIGAASSARAGVRRHVPRELSARIRHLITAMTWLERTPTSHLDDDTRRRIEQVRARAERLTTLLRSTVDLPDLVPAPASVRTKIIPRHSAPLVLRRAPSGRYDRP